MLVNVWGDESSQNAHKFMVLGTIWQNPICAVDLERDVQALKKTTGFEKEFHWNELKGHQLTAYKGLVELFKEYADQGLLKYRSIVVDQSDRNHKIYSSDDELHFYKMYFWLIYKRLIPTNKYDIFLDRKPNSIPGRLSDLKNALNNRMIGDSLSQRGEYIEPIVRRVEPRDGSQVELQMTDVFTGAIAYVRNGSYDAAKNPKNPKRQLVDHIQEIIGVDLASCHGPYESQNFNIWCFRRQN